MGCTGTEGKFGTMWLSSCGILRASVMSAITKQDMWAKREMVSVTSRFFDCSKSNNTGK